MTIPNLNWVVNGRPIITAYLVMVLIGVLVTLFYMMHFATRHGRDEIRVMFTTLIGFAGAFIGGKLLGAIVNYETTINFFRNVGSYGSFAVFVNELGKVFGDSVFYGGLICMLLFDFIYLRKTEKQNTGAYFDLVAFGIPLFHGFGRIGCLLSGCCFGRPASFGVIYDSELSNAPKGVTLLPVQLFEAILNFALFFFLRELYKRGKMKGKLIWLYLLIYPTYRFILEFFRYDSYRGFVLGLSTSQFISVLLFAFAAIMLTVKLLREKKQRGIAEKPLTK